MICLQETKLQPHQVSFELPGYRMYFNSADKAGYSGTAVFTKQPKRQKPSFSADFLSLHREAFTTLADIR